MCALCVFIYVYLFLGPVVSDVSYELKQHTLNARQKLLKFEKIEEVILPVCWKSFGYSLISEFYVFRAKLQLEKTI